jgi:LmbE family N-acetylglucosaminyl deacetylase
MASRSHAAALNVLVVDAEPTHACMAQQWLADTGQAMVRHVANTDLGTRLSNDQPWDLIVADDVPAPGERRKPLKSARAADRWTSLLLVPTIPTVETAQRALQSQFDGLLFKPVQKEAFLDQAMFLAETSRNRRQRERKRVLAIGAHPDDVEIGCGGAMAKHQAQGDELMILTLSRGAVGGDTAVRMREAEQAARLLGATLEMGDLPDTRIPDGVETIQAIQAAIRAFDPTHVYTHTSHDAHQDHRAVHAASLVAARNVHNVYCYQSPSSTVDFRPNHFVDIADYIERKVEVLGAHESQVSRSPGLQREFTIATALYWGRHSNHVPAEPMEIVRQSCQ